MAGRAQGEMFYSEILSTQYDKWRRLIPSENMLKDFIVPLTSVALAYLKENPVRLPSSCVPPSTIRKSSFSSNSSWGSGGESEDEMHGTVALDGYRESELSTRESSDVCDLVRLLDEGLKKLGGGAHVRMNWSSPQDAKWINGGSMSCTSPRDILLLLKSSNWISRDLSTPFSYCTDAADSGPTGGVDYYIVLINAREMPVTMQFRVFVTSDAIQGICQRDLTARLNFLVEDPSLQLKIKLCIEIFFANVLKKRLLLSRYICDLFLETKGTALWPWVLDISPFGPPSDPLLFTWDELVSKEPGGRGGNIPDNGVDLRLVSDVGRDCNPEDLHSVPKEFLDVNAGRMDSEEAEQLLRDLEREGKHLTSPAKST